MYIKIYLRNNNIFKIKVGSVFVCYEPFIIAWLRIGLISFYGLSNRQKSDKQKQTREDNPNQGW